MRLIALCSLSGQNGLRLLSGGAEPYQHPQTQIDEAHEERTAHRLKWYFQYYNDRLRWGAMQDAGPPLPSERFRRRERYAASVADECGIDESLIALQVRRFYEAVRCDPVLGPVFACVTDWESHLARITAFWSSVALMSGRYHGNPLAAHRPLPINAEHFARWLALWRATASETCPPPAAARFTLLAERIAASLSRALGT